MRGTGRRRRNIKKRCRNNNLINSNRNKNRDCRQILSAVATTAATLAKTNQKRISPRRKGTFLIF